MSELLAASELPGPFETTPTTRNMVYHLEKSGPFSLLGDGPRDFFKAERPGCLFVSRLNCFFYGFNFI